MNMIISFNKPPQYDIIKVINCKKIRKQLLKWRVNIDGETYDTEVRKNVMGCS